MKRCLVHPHPLRSAPHTQMPTACIGLLSDTHGVFDPVSCLFLTAGLGLGLSTDGLFVATTSTRNRRPLTTLDTHPPPLPTQAAAALLKGVELILHAGDVGHHGGHAGKSTSLLAKSLAPTCAVCVGVANQSAHTLRVHASTHNTNTTPTPRGSEGFCRGHHLPDSGRVWQCRRHTQRISAAAPTQGGGRRGVEAVAGPHCRICRHIQRWAKKGVDYLVHNHTVRVLLCVSDNTQPPAPNTPTPSLCAVVLSLACHRVSSPSPQSCTMCCS